MRLIDADALKQWIYNLPILESEQAQAVCVLIDNFPTAEESRPKGKWIYSDGLYECFNCHYLIGRGYEEEYRFCPNCGADMRGEE